MGVNVCDWVWELIPRIDGVSNISKVWGEVEFSSEKVLF